jgi:hypothetical protein
VLERITADHSPAACLRPASLRTASLRTAAQLACACPDRERGGKLALSAGLLRWLRIVFRVWLGVGLLRVSCSLVGACVWGGLHSSALSRLPRSGSPLGSRLLLLADSCPWNVMQRPASSVSLLFSPNFGAGVPARCRSSDREWMQPGLIGR